MSMRFYDRHGRPMTFAEWVAWIESDKEGAQRIVQQTHVGEAQVSTVWLGLDHAWGRGGPLIFETMIFGGPHDGFQERYTTEAEATLGHGRVVARLEAGLSPEPEERAG